MLTTSIVPNVWDIVGAVVGLVDARKTSEGLVTERLDRGDAAGGTAASHGEGIGAEIKAQGPNVEGRDVQDGGWEVEGGAIVRGENG